MGAEHPTGTDTKVESADQPRPSDKPPPPPPDRPGSPGQASRLESRAAAQRPPEAEKPEAPPITRSARAEKSNDPNDDPNRVGTPRADSRRVAAGENVPQAAPKTAEKTDTRTVEDDDTRDAGTPRADSGKREENDGITETDAGQDIPGEQQGSQGQEAPPLHPEASTTDRPDDTPLAPQRDGQATSGGAAEDAAEAPGPQSSADLDVQTPLADTRPDDDAPPLSHGTPEPGPETGREAEARPERDEDPPLDASATAESADTGSQPDETVEGIADGRTDREAGPESERSPEASDGEPPVRPARETTEEPETPEDAPRQETSDGTIDEPGDDEPDRGRNTEEPTEPRSLEETRDPFAHLPTRADLDPVGAGVWTSDRGELDPVNENQDLREPDPERDSPFKRALRGMSNNTEDALKHANAIGDDLQGALGGHRPPSDFPTGSRDTTPTMKAVDNLVQVPSALVGVVSGAMVMFAAARGARALVTSFLRRNNDR